VHARPEPVETGRLGMCGLLETYPDAPHDTDVIQDHVMDRDPEGAD
jgi:hypothetical protein